MSNRVKVKPTRLGARRVDIFYPMVTDPEGTGPASVEAMGKLVELAGAWRVGKPACLLWRGKAKALEVLKSLADGGYIPSDERHLAMVSRAHELGDEACLVLARGQMLESAARQADQ